MYTHYIGNIVYEGSTLAYIITEVGRLVAFGTGTDRKFLYEYNLKDHLGNSRVTFMGTDLGGAVDIVQTTSYYPFGLVINQMNGNTATGYNKNKYLYNGKELQDDVFAGSSLNWFDYGARFYDPQIGRWHVVDPKVEEYFYITPYNYPLNNPIMLIDPDGKKVKLFFKEQGVTAGAVYGGSVARQWGYAVDDVGRTWYQFNKRGFTNPEKDGTMAFGGEISVATGGFARSKNDRTFSDFLNNNSTPSITLGPVSVSSDFDGYLSISGGLSAGFSYSNANTSDVKSYSVDKNEAAKLGKLAGGKSFLDIDSFSIEFAETKNKNGDVSKDLSKGYLIMQLPGEKPINTGVLMNKNFKGGSEVWESVNYSDKKKQDEK